MMSLGLPRSNDTFSKLLSSSVGRKCISNIEEEAWKLRLRRVADDRVPTWRR